MDDPVRAQYQARPDAPDTQKRCGQGAYWSGDVDDRARDCESVTNCVCGCSSRRVLLAVLRGRCRVACLGHQRLRHTERDTVIWSLPEHFCGRCSGRKLSLRQFNRRREKTNRARGGRPGIPTVLPLGRRAQCAFRLSGYFALRVCGFRPLFVIFPPHRFRFWAKEAMWRALFVLAPPVAAHVLPAPLHRPVAARGFARCPVLPLLSTTNPM